MLSKYGLGAVVALALGVYAVSGCATIGHTHTTTPEPPEPPEPVPLTDAIQSVVAALDQLATRSDNKPFHGLLPAEVEVVLEVEAGRSTEGGLSVKVLPAIAEIGGEWSSEVTRSEGNTITIKFSNILLAEQDTLAGLENTDKLAERIERLRTIFNSMTR